jgi:hypothetical protein
MVEANNTVCLRWSCPCFSHSKSANNTFQLHFPAKQTVQFRSLSQERCLGNYLIFLENIIRIYYFFEKDEI